MLTVKPYVHEVKYYECDRMGVTHHSNYVRFMEEARIWWLDCLGYGYERMEAEGIVSPVVAISCNYKHTTTFKDKIEIEVKVAELTGLQLGFSYVMKVDGKVVCTANCTHCFLDGGRPVVLSERFPQLYEAIVGTMQA